MTDYKIPGGWVAPDSPLHGLFPVCVEGGWVNYYSSQDNWTSTKEKKQGVQWPYVASIRLAWVVYQALQLTCTLQTSHHIATKTSETRQTKLARKRPEGLRRPPFFKKIPVSTLICKLSTTASEAYQSTRHLGKRNRKEREGKISCSSIH